MAVSEFEMKNGKEGETQNELLIFTNIGKSKIEKYNSVIDNRYEFSETLWVVSIVNTKGNALLSGHAVIVLEGVDAGGRVLMLDEETPEPSSIEPNEIVLRKTEGSITAYWNENSTVFKKPLDKGSMEALCSIPDFPQSGWNCEITHRENAVLFNKLISICGCPQIDTTQRRFINQYDMTSNSTDDMEEQSSLNQKGYITKIRCYEYDKNRQDYSKPFPHRSYYVSPEAAKKMITAIKKEAEFTEIAMSNWGKPGAPKPLKYQKLGSAHPLVKLFGNSEHGNNCAGWCQDKMNIAAESTHKPKPPTSSVCSMM